MLELSNIVKKYLSGDNEVSALNGVNLKFRKNEFVSILGASGCGKTTMLNIIGGLDRYTSGDLIINGISTKQFKDSDWDSYRNHSIGFVFQSYNLIPHQSVLSNVELALTLSGVSKSERRARATEALTKVGLGDQLHKRPNQMSGGQMQRVAIARALVNNPDILLADEPTGALDTTTSVQIMELLKEVAKDKLVIMVTHNPELAETYSTRIVRLRDGMVIDDSNPYDGDNEPLSLAEEVPPVEIQNFASKKSEKKAGKQNKGKKKKTSMSFATALSLSLNNLMTKKGRTILTSFAGSIGIIGIALILSLSNGIQGYINQVQEDTLSTYPLTISKYTTDFSAMMSAMTEVSNKKIENPDPNKIYVDDSMGTMLSAMSATVENDLESFKIYLDSNYEKIADSVSDIQYTYDFDLQLFTEDGKTQVSPTTIFDNMGEAFAGMDEMMETMGGLSILSEMIDNPALLDQQYELVGEGSHWPTAANEVVLVIGSDNQISKMTLYMLGVLDQSELEEILTNLLTGGEYESAHMQEYDLNDFLGMKFRLLNTSDFYAKKEGATYTVDGVTYPEWYDMRKVAFDQEAFVTSNGTEMVISGIIRPREGATATSISGAIGYTRALTDMILEQNTKSEIIHQQKATPNHNVLNGVSFERIRYTRENINTLIAKIDPDSMAQFYDIMTREIRKNEEYSSLLTVNVSTYPLFVCTLPDEELAQTLSKLLAKAQTNPMAESMLGGLFAVMKQVPDGLSSVDFTVSNIIDLLPLMSEAQIMLLINGVSATEEIPFTFWGLQDLCGSEFMSEQYAEMNESIQEWKINEKSFTLLLQSMDDTLFYSLEEMLYQMLPEKDATLESNLKLLGDAEKASPASINFYAKNFESKDTIEAFIAEYNDGVDEIQKLKYTDLIGLMMSSVSIIIDAISYVLIAFVSISLVVSSIMIGIITYISVLERTKEIGILRSIGASKKDISRVFNAETLIVGFTAGFIGILLTVILCLPINLIIRALSGITGISASLPLVAAIILVAISMLLTLIAGLLPSRLAAKKDPVEALRSE